MILFALPQKKPSSPWGRERKAPAVPPQLAARSLAGVPTYPRPR